MTDVRLDDAHWEGVDAGTEALVDAWQVKEGEHVAAGQPLVKVVLVKTALEVAAPVAGVIERILKPAESTFARGAPLAVIGEG